jgi:dihydroorotase
LRSAAEQTALLNAVADGTIDCIATHHMPQDYDSKVLEFEYAKNGMTGLETCYPVLKTILPSISEKRWVELLSLNARKIFGLEKPVIDINQRACFTLFSPEGKTQIDTNGFYSKSINTPFAGKELNGQVFGTVQQDKIFIRNKKN